MAEAKKEKTFEVIKGKLPIIISAPHCVQQTRNNMIKNEEGETGAIAQIVSEKTNCYAIFKTYNNNDDANFDIENNPYKEALIKLTKDNKIKLLIDLHGAEYSHDFDIDIGTDEGKNIQQNQILIQEMKQSFIDNGIKNVKIDDTFKATSMHTICKFISSQTQIPCIQLEINGKYRYIKNLDGTEKFINGLIDFINKIKEKI